MKIDMHSHIIPKEVVAFIRNEGYKYGAAIRVKEEREWIEHQQGYVYPLLPHFYDEVQKLRDMDHMNIDFTVLSPAPPMFMYWIDSAVAARFARLVNQGTSDFVSADTQHFLGFATIPMQDPMTAIKELEYAGKLPGLCGVEIGTTIEGKSLDHPSFEPFFTLCEELNWPVFLHPYYVGDKAGLSKYYLTNLMGNPLDTAFGAASLIFGGVLDRHPKLRVLLAHGGGYLPYQIGRLDHGYSVRQESKTCAEKPSAYLQRFFYDCITFNTQALAFLLQLIGPDRVVLGTDYPFDMAELNPIGRLQEASIHDQLLFDKVTNQNALSLLER